MKTAENAADQSVAPRFRPRLASMTACGLVLIACGAPRAVSNTVPSDQVNDVALASLSSGFVGCPPDEMEVSDYRFVTFERDVVRAPSSETWTVRCRGAVFHCSHSSVAYSCAPALRPDDPSVGP